MRTCLKGKPQPHFSPREASPLLITGPALEDSERQAPHQWALLHEDRGRKKREVFVFLVCTLRLCYRCPPMLMRQAFAKACIRSPATFHSLFGCRRAIDSQWSLSSSPLVTSSAPRMSPMSPLGTGRSGSPPPQDP